MSRYLFSLGRRFEQMPFHRSDWSSEESDASPAGSYRVPDNEEPEARGTSPYHAPDISLLSSDSSSQDR